MKIYSYKTREEKAKKTKSRFSFKWPKFTFKKTWTWIFRSAALSVFLIALLFLYYAKDLPDPNKLLERNVAESTKIFARDGSLLYEVHGEAKRTLINLDQVSKYVPQATIAIEDKDFYKHHGISFTGILRSVIRYVINRGPSGGGGSTITQQFVKNAILANKDGIFGRKIPEAILSLTIEAKFSKEEILKLYLNEIPYGRNAYGIEAAAQTFFGKRAIDLNLAESAYLAALPQRTTYFEPYGQHREALDTRKNLVLTNMREQGYITPEEEKTAKEATVDFKKARTAIIAPQFVLMVQNYLEEKYGQKTLQEGGLKVYTTLDPRLQAIAEKAVKEGAESNAKKYNANNAALVAVDPKTGHILAMVGSKDYFGTSFPEGCSPGKNCLFEPNVNVAISNSTQPGSSFKPYAYVTAFKKEHGFSPATLLMDVETNFGTFAGKVYQPSNYDGSERGPVSIRQALAGSLNIPAVKTVALIGVEDVVQTARDLGITSPMADCGLSLVLGGCEVKLVDHVAAFSVLANGGIKNEKTSIIKILDKNDSVLEEYKENPKEVLDPQAVYQVVNIMTDNNARAYIFGANSPLVLPGRTVAAKTGTTNQWRDGWTVGFTPSLAAGVWAGNNCGTKCLMKTGADGVFVAAPIWNAFMKEALKDTPAEQFKVPPGITKILVDSVSGKLPTGLTPNTKEEVFASYNVPTEFDNIHIERSIDSQTGLPATSTTPPEQIISQKYTVFHSEKRDNPNWENAVQAWAVKNGYLYPVSEIIPDENPQTGDSPTVEILEPVDKSTITKLPFKVTVSATSKNLVTRAELSLNGNLVKTLNSSPYVFNFDSKLEPGKHTLAVKVVDSKGQSSDTSIEITYDPTMAEFLQMPE